MTSAAANEYVVATANFVAASIFLIALSGLVEKSGEILSMSETGKEEDKPVYENTNGVPLTNGRNLHMNLKAGEIANRIITVGSTSRAEKIAESMDSSPSPVTYASDRGFTTISGYFNGVYVSVVAIGMGNPMMDFLMRESRAVVTGPMAMIRYGTCGALTTEAAAGSVVVNSGGSGYVRRNPDAFTYMYCEHTAADCQANNGQPAKRAKRENVKSYSFCDIAPADVTLSKLLVEELKNEVGGSTLVLEGINVTADSFYSTQGRRDEKFADDNEDVIDAIIERYPGVQTLEMETFQMMHLGLCCKDPIRTAAAVIVVANRPSGKVMDGALLDKLEKDGGRATLAAITALQL